MASLLAPKVRRLRAPFVLTFAALALVTAPGWAGDPPKGSPPAAAAPQPSGSASAPPAGAAAPAASDAPPDAPPDATGEEPAPGSEVPPAPPPSAPGEPIDEATMLFDMGTAAIDEGKFDEAAKMLARVWEKKKTYDVAAALGTAERKLGRNRDAAEHLSFALRNLPPSELGSTQKTISDELAAARAEVGELKVTVNLDGAEVRIGDKVIGVSPIAEPVFVDPGTFTVTVSKAGFDSASQTVSVVKGVSVGASLSLEARNRTPAYVLGAGGIAALAAGVVLVSVSQVKLGEGRSIRDSILKSGGSCGGASPPADCDALRDAGATADATGTASIVAFGLGAAALGAGLAYYFWPSSSDSGGAKAGARVVPVAAPGAGGLVISGSF
ncbi:MAG: PEGA domain-containing protein [Polyangiaceae bacterium]